MGETEEFAEALLDQIAVELNEEKEIGQLSNKITDDKDFPQQFTSMEDFSEQNLPVMAEKVHDFTGIEVKSNIKIEFPDLKEFKLLKGKKVQYSPDKTRHQLCSSLIGKEETVVPRLHGLLRIY